jgi:hypothetical protein
MQIDPSMSLDFPNSMPAPTPGLSPTAAMGTSAGSPEAILESLLRQTGGDPNRLISLLTQILMMLTGGEGGEAGGAPPADVLDPSMMGMPSQAPPML